MTNLETDLVLSGQIYIQFLLYLLIAFGILYVFSVIYNLTQICQREERYIVHPTQI